MPRAQSADFLHSMRFWVQVVDPIADSVRTLQPSVRDSLQVQAGFQSVTTPDLTIEPVEYKEGTMVYTRKQAGNPTVSDVTMTRGVTRSDSAFWLWAKTVVEGEAEYRADLEILQYGRERFLGRTPLTAGQNYTEVDPLTASPGKTIKCFNCFPIRCKPTADFDGTASDIAIAEIDFALESFDIINGPVPTTG